MKALPFVVVAAAILSSCYTARERTVTGPSKKWDEISAQKESEARTLRDLLEINQRSIGIATRWLASLDKLPAEAQNTDTSRAAEYLKEKLARIKAGLLSQQQELETQRLLGDAGLRTEEFLVVHKREIAKLGEFQEALNRISVGDYR